MPARDRGAVDAGFLNRHIELALRARAALAWGAEVPFNIFLNNVLPYASLNEQREVWRHFLFEELSPIVRLCANTLQAADVINQNIWGRWRIQLNNTRLPQVMSPSQVLATGQASSMSLSIFLVNALRSLAIPARLVGTVEWRAASGSHTWVEVWHNGRWSFLDSGEYRPVNDTWFYPIPARNQVAGNPQHGIFAASFQHEVGEVPLPWAPGNHGIDVTPHYK
ncbi:hypothetical protein WJX73_007447 [Symbiochloris irregularis]|uniref:Transglutaminase-like domain-containing protein n=1 Tax=Symbiochloris irregularis TaxID=706552 RepID=A0AAW1PM50_9CHLO